MDITPPQKDADTGISFWQLLKSTFSAFIGVQSNRNRERDFQQGKISHFIGIGLLLGLILILALIAIGQIVVALAGH